MVGLAATFGSGAMTNSINDFDDADLFLVTGSNTTEQHPLIGSRIINAKQRGAQLLIIDPREIPLAKFADLHLRQNIGTDVAVLNGMMNVIINENLHDKEFINNWTVGFEGLKKLVQAYSLEYVEKVTWVPADKIKKAAILFATTKPAQIVTTANSTTHHTNGLQNHRAIILLPAITGNIDTPTNDMTPNPIINDITLHERVGNMPPGVGSQRFPIWTKQIQEMQSNALADQIDTSNPYPIKALFSAGLDIQFFPNSNRIADSLKKHYLELNAK